MKVLVILGSPRKKGNSETLTAQIVKGIADAGADVETVRLQGMDIHPCLGCGNCEKEGQCIIKDDMPSLYEKISGADRIVMVSPIYFYGVTAQAKAFIDRCQTLWSRKYILKQRLQGSVPKKGYFVSVCATKGDRIFDGAILTVKYGFDAMDFAYGGDFLVRGVDEKGAINAFAGKLEEAFLFGRSIVEG